MNGAILAHECARLLKARVLFGRPYGAQLLYPLTLRLEAHTLLPGRMRFMEPNDKKNTYELKLMTRQQVAEMLQVDTATLRRYYTTGQMPPPRRLGGQLRWPLQELQTWLDELPQVDR